MLSRSRLLSDWFISRKLICALAAPAMLLAAGKSAIADPTTTFNWSCIECGDYPGATTLLGLSASITFDGNVPVDGSTFTGIPAFLTITAAGVKQTYSLPATNQYWYGALSNFAPGDWDSALALQRIGPAVYATLAGNTAASSGSVTYNQYGGSTTNPNPLAVFGLTGSFDTIAGTPNAFYAVGQFSTQLPTPTTAQLANLSVDAYNTNPLGTDGFAVRSHLDYNNGLVADIYGNADNSQLVIAFRGTDKNNGKNILVDDIIAAGVHSALYDEYMTEASQIVKTLSSANPNSNITLTGHSLGGAIAQLLGEATGVDTVAFDAPGAQKSYGTYGGDYVALPKLGDGSLNVNYRLYGDPISQSGTQVGNVITVGNSSTNTNLIDALANHSPELIAAAMQPNSGAVQTSGFLGPDYTTQIGNIVKYALASAPVLLFNQFVSARDHYFIDPDAYNNFVFTENGGSPFLATLELPAATGVAAYDFRYEVGTVWSQFQILSPDSTITFVPGVDGVEFDALNQSGAATLMPNGFMFDTTFASSGNLSASLTEINTIAPSVPEPRTAPLMLLGLSALILANRRKLKGLILG